MQKAFSRVLCKVDFILYCNLVTCYDQVQSSLLLAQNSHRNQISRPGILNDVVADVFSPSRQFLGY